MQPDGFGLNIQQLLLKNFATFDDQTIKFNDNFNAIVGETGSGKSLILDALQLILGHRADKKLIRKDCDFAIVEASFICEDTHIKNYFHDIGHPPESSEIVIKRILYKSGKTKSFLNHISCSLGTLTEFSRKYIDLVGQFENQKLLSEDYQIQLLDHFCANQSLLIEYQKTFKQYLDEKASLEQLINNEAEMAQKLDYINFQIQELERHKISHEHEEKLLEKKRLLLNIEENKTAISQLNALFDGDSNDKGLLPTLNNIENHLSPRLLDEEALNQFFHAKEILTDLNYKINSSLEIEFDEDEFESIIDELDHIQKLKRKFNTDTQGLIDIYQKFLSEKDQIENINHNITSKRNIVTQLKNEAQNLASKLHQKRQKYAVELSNLLTKEIRKLRMKGATAKINLKELNELNKNGHTHISFVAETNPGEGFFKVKDIASGGELSRILLAVRTILSSKDSISIFLFDEIDTGIGGETALTVGKSLLKVSHSSQVIAITHLPQIANFAQKLITVSKDVINSEKGDRTVSLVKEISGSDVETFVKKMAPLN
ncbi:MAG: AAA family ATPase [Bacteriovoracaceae bacterium]|jgi:DNA repair protein RecN (Recombination protein N)|nr:AAA family ATPase [Bacteriovoracaceae bacterium]